MCAASDFFSSAKEDLGYLNPDCRVPAPDISGTSTRLCQRLKPDLRGLSREFPAPVSPVSPAGAPLPPYSSKTSRRLEAHYSTTSTKVRGAAVETSLHVSRSFAVGVPSLRSCWETRSGALEREFNGF